MKYRRLGQTDIEVSLIGLGSMTWGKQNTQGEAHAQLDHAVDAGVNFIDTAEMYPVPVAKDTFGDTEAIIGSWLKRRGDRSKLIIASKVCAAADWLPYVRDGKNRLDKKNIESAVDDSLRRLQTDYIDLYQTHWPERDTNYFGRLGYYHAPEKDGVPIEETLQVLGDLVQAGKIRHIGASNETPWGVAEWLRLSKKHHLPRIASIQNPYSLLNRSFEIGLSEFAQREAVGLLAYSPLGFGVLSGKYLDNTQPEGARLTLFGKQYKRYVNEAGIRSTAAYVRLAREYALAPAQMALAFVNTRPFVSSTIIGATRMEQLQANIASVHLELPKPLLREIERIHTAQANPCP